MASSAAPVATAAATAAPTVQAINTNLLNVKDEDFKYTLSTERKLHVKNTYPIINELIQLPSRINWGTYKFNGSSTFLVQNTEENNADFTLDKTAEFRPYVIPDAEASYPDTIIPFSFFGGCVYELLHNQLKKDAAGAPHIREFIDPTGDIDISLLRPKITTTSGMELTSDFKNVQLTEINEIIDHWTEWVWFQFHSVVRESRVLREYLGHNTEDFDYKADHEGKLADKAEKIDHLWVLRARVNNMMKVQLCVKYKGATDSEHILEFVYPLIEMEPIKFQVNQRESKTIFVGPHMVESFGELFKGNYDSITHRLGFIGKPEFQHKFYNHVQRLRYLNRIIPIYYKKYNVDNNNKISYTLRSILNTLCYLNLILYNPTDSLALERGRINDNYAEIIKIISEQIKIDPELYCKFDYKYSGSLPPPAGAAGAAAPAQAAGPCLKAQKDGVLLSLFSDILSDDFIRIRLFGLNKSGSLLFSVNFTENVKILTDFVNKRKNIGGARRKAQYRLKKTVRKSHNRRKNKTTKNMRVGVSVARGSKSSSNSY
jgi:hypothetical protein